MPKSLLNKRDCFICQKVVILDANSSFKDHQTKEHFYIIKNAKKSSSTKEAVESACKRLSEILGKIRFFVIKWCKQKIFKKEFCISFYTPSFLDFTWFQVKKILLLQPPPKKNIYIYKGRPKNSSRGTKLLCTPTSKSCSLFETP